MDQIYKLCHTELPRQNFTCIGVSVIDFKAKNFESFYLGDHSYRFFDLASISKVLNLA